MAACYGGLEDFAQILVEQGADIDAANDNGSIPQYLCSFLVRSAHLICGFLLCGWIGFTALLFAASEGYQDTVRVLLEKGARIDICSSAGITPLMAGCSGGLHELIMHIISSSKRQEMDRRDENGWTALMHAVANESEKCGLCFQFVISSTKKQ